MSNYTKILPRKNTEENWEYTNMNNKIIIGNIHQKINYQKLSLPFASSHNSEIL